MRPAPNPAGRPAGRPPGRRPRRARWWTRLLVVLLAVGGVGLAAFTWFAYWPLEGRVDRVEGLVPSDVDFLYRTSWREVKASGWLRRNVFDDPVHPSLDPSKVVVSDPGQPRETFADALARIPESEAEINDSIPGPLKVLEGIFFGTKEFRVEKDLFPGEVVAAGRWCGGGSPAEGPPRWREILLLTRVSPLVKFAFEAMRHDFVRERAVARPDLSITATSDGLLRVETSAPPPRKRQTCEGGYEVGPMNVWWVARVKDVIAISNAEDLAQKVKGVGVGEGDGALLTRDFEVDRPEGGLAASLDLVGLRSYLARFFSAQQSDAVGALVGKFIAVDSLESARATVTPLEDGLVVRADVGYAEGRMREFRDVAATYDQRPEPLAGGIARLLPAKDTALVMQVTTPARAILRAIYDQLSASDRGLIAKRVASISERRKEQGKQAYDDAYGFLDDLAAQLGTSSVLAVARIPYEIRDDMYQEWYSAADPEPTAAYSAMVRIRDGARQEEVDAFLADRLAAIGAFPPERVTSPEGIEYSRIVFDELPAQYRLYKPAFKVHDGYFILSTREEYLLEILKVMRGGPDAPANVESTKEFRAVSASLPKEATLALVANGDTLRALLWDFRNTEVRRRHDDAEYAMRYRARRMADLAAARGGRSDFAADKAKVDEELPEEMKRYRTEGYRRFVEEYRGELDAWSRIAGFGFAMQASRDRARLDVGARVLLRPAAGAR